MQDRKHGPEEEDLACQIQDPKLHWTEAIATHHALFEIGMLAIHATLAIAQGEGGRFRAASKGEGICVSHISPRHAQHDVRCIALPVFAFPGHSVLPKDHVASGPWCGLV